MALGLVRQDASEWTRIEPGFELSYPRDHGSHPDTRTEWWYLTGHLTATTGREFGYQLTFFRSGLDSRPLGPDDSPLRARQVHAAHFALCDIESGRTLFTERLRRAPGGFVSCSESDLDIVLDDWWLRRQDKDVLHLSAADRELGTGLALTLQPTKPRVLHGEGGVSFKGGEQGNASAYMSWPRMQSTGTLELEGETYTVQGTSWFDHEFGSSVLGQGVLGWDWFGLHLDDGTDLMLFVLRREDGTLDPASAATRIDAAGQARKLESSAFRLTTTDTWKSPTTGATYPSGWRIEIPGEGLDLRLTPSVENAELRSARSTGVTYWEGPVQVQGTTGGQGYAELTGYAGSMGGRL